MMFTKRGMFTAAMLIATMASVSGAYAADAGGCRDFQDVGRFQGSSLIMCANKEFAEYVLPTGPMRDFDFDRHKATFEQQLSLEGQLTENVYAVPLGSSSAQVFRNFRQLLQSRNYSFLFEGKQAELGDHFGSYFESFGPGTQLWGYSPDEARYLAASKDENGVKTFIALYVLEYDDGFDRNFEAKKGQVLVRMDTLRVGELSNQMAVVTASEIERKISENGRIALYGIHFDFNSAIIRPESRPAIEQIAAYLASHPDRALSIVGHTDSIGGPDFNMQLSRARSDAVAVELVRGFGIAPARLNALGAGQREPVAPNDTDEGRAMNRRVELVPR